jgi:hypothetical protein
MRRRWKALGAILMLVVVLQLVCVRKPLDPLPKTRDPLLVGTWLQSTGPFNAPELALRVRLNGDGSGNASVPADNSIFAPLQWGTTGNKLIISRPSTDIGPVYESAFYALDAAGSTIRIRNQVRSMVNRNRLRTFGSPLILCSDLKRE